MTGPGVPQPAKNLLCSDLSLLLLTVPLCKSHLQQPIGCQVIRSAAQHSSDPKRPTCQVCRPHPWCSIRVTWAAAIKLLTNPSERQPLFLSATAETHLNGHFKATLMHLDQLTMTVQLRYMAIFRKKNYGTRQQE